ncbi:MAG: glycogen/starch/alpha-glucan phosphorylase [Gammaproteobacteria bacterium]|nr:glycogen/starch/alpha-glucan phosphorylase [Gammaproteobacteria bacterium]
MNIRTGFEVEEIRQAFLNNLFYVQAKNCRTATLNDRYLALAYTVRDRMLERWMKSLETYFTGDVRVVSYLSAEYLPGPHLANNMVNLGICDAVEQAMQALDIDVHELFEQEEEPGLGNGGLGRLAACYMDSLATREVPAIGYGIRYEFGIFDQQLQDGWQVERTDHWLQLGNPWEIARPETTFEVKLGGHTEQYTTDDGRRRVRWAPERVVKGMAYDTPITGFRVDTVALLRLWKAEAPRLFRFRIFNKGDYYGAVEDNVAATNLTRILYPNDEPEQGKQLRLEQQYFFVSCSLQDMIRVHLRFGRSLRDFSRYWAGQLNDTHPSIAIAELLRLLVDEHGLDRDEAWEITRSTFAYTNHTLLPEALEVWPVTLFARVLPRHLEIIYEINELLLEEVRQQFPGDDRRLARMSLIDENDSRRVRMANLACAGSHTINGVAELHTRLLKQYTLNDFHELYPDKFRNITNGVTPRRWIALCNRGLAELIADHIGMDWVSDLEELRKLEAFVDDGEFRAQWWQVKQDKKREQATFIQQRTGIGVDPDSLFDVQVKRIHEYKRQHLNILHIITLYQRIRENPAIDIQPRTFVFGGKAAPGYDMAKLIIKLITSVADVVNNDPLVADRLKVVFIPNFNVKTGHHIYPMADLSEQISTAGKEASGTGNMKFAMNGALTIGTLDGANIEIREEVGKENFFLFGATASEIRQLKAEGYHPELCYKQDVELHQVIDAIRSGVFSNGDTGLFRPLVDSLLMHDEYLLLHDYRSYITCQEQVSRRYADRDAWLRSSILNTARIGKFSSDRAIRQYCEEVWNVQPVVATSATDVKTCGMQETA